VKVVYRRFTFPGARFSSTQLNKYEIWSINSKLNDYGVYMISHFEKSIDILSQDNQHLRTNVSVDGCFPTAVYFHSQLPFESHVAEPTGRALDNDRVTTTWKMYISDLTHIPCFAFNTPHSRSPSCYGLSQRCMLSHQARQMKHEEVWERERKCEDELSVWGDRYWQDLRIVERSVIAYSRRAMLAMVNYELWNKIIFEYELVVCIHIPVFNVVRIGIDRFLWSRWWFWF
jgi:hypothetical protein